MKMFIKFDLWLQSRFEIAKNESMIIDGYHLHLGWLVITVYRN